MPELPEMENYRILLSKQILDIPITGVTVSREKSINTEVETFEKQLLGTTVVYLERRGKHLIFHLNTGGRLVLHLMLGGLLYLGTEEQRPDRTVQIELDFSGLKLYFIGLRLGYLHLLTAKETEEALSDLGPDPLDRRMTLEKFTARLKGRRGILKTTLVNQQIFSGIGNCYSDEIAYIAGFTPGSKVQNIVQSPEKVEKLYHATQSVLREATAEGGYMEMPLMEGDTLTGGFDHQCRVYDREGEESPSGGKIVRVELAGKKAFYCPVQQHDA
ncbi:MULTISPECIES: Fpg/Nei family DNA glycosylase [Paenibacillus]|jgi:formamidopyrimidine-DNA glycosylase|uniref:DNA-formamidopyrimidine glycosylase family protein n=2 Tax=Paenibacillus TaxID=44249 RepID=A0AAJ3IVK9_PAEPO|nr:MULTISPECIES: DNA-formamidopyrimidine glycosylase family protein [Paenibacillus]ALA42577.1 formamidopyrimidine-DNA glycosylase [Paenibacillus peoriae]APQ59756.1 formamidopyrimidine-DNA glycosylase [Paenibacillus polymyxa]MCP3743045.1 Fpg/Nei family DNA glycosylase [Paenibacillus sp. A3M_27_13]MDH2331790.1 DNA-formamidopyrimidine glycosylase family protein [Paenibacillus polymyxa]MDR6776176.1 formamidopyrimidine-DNA glycosylase [Paenibacillus peoriae]